MTPIRDWKHVRSEYERRKDAQDRLVGVAMIVTAIVLFLIA